MSTNEKTRLQFKETGFVCINEKDLGFHGTANADNLSANVAR